MPIALSSGVTKMPRCVELTTCSPKTISPASGLSSPATHLRSVVLPDPLSPRSTKNSCSFTCRSTPSTAWTASVPVLKVFLSEWITIILNYLNGLNVVNGRVCLIRLTTPKQLYVAADAHNPITSDQRRHDRHHDHSKCGRIAQPTPLPLPPNISR